MCTDFQQRWCNYTRANVRPSDRRYIYTCAMCRFWRPSENVSKIITNGKICDSYKSLSSLRYVWYKSECSFSFTDCSCPLTVHSIYSELHEAMFLRSVLGDFLDLQRPRNNLWDNFQALIDLLRVKYENESSFDFYWFRGNTVGLMYNKSNLKVR